MNPLLKYRTSRELSQKQMAEMLGVTQAFISFVENNHRGISPTLAKKWEQITDGELRKEALVWPDQAEGTAA